MTGINVQTTDVSGVAVATPVGRLDLSSYAELRDSLLKQAANAPDALLVRLGQDFETASVAMLAVFTTVRKRISQWPDVPLVLVAETERHRHELTSSGVARHAAIEPDLGSALERVQEPLPRRCRRVSLPKSLVAPLMARDALRESCEEWGLTALVDDAFVVATELVENAVRHARSESVLRIELRDSGLSIAVRDDAPEPPVLGTTQPGVPRHRGLALVEQLCVAWGTTPSFGGGKVVWAVLAPRGTRWF